MSGAMVELRADLTDRFISDHPDAAARVLEQMAADDIGNWLPSLPLHQACRVLERTLPAYAGRALSDMDSRYAAELFGCLSSTTAAAILRACTPSRRRDLLARMNPSTSTQIRMLLNFAEDSVGYWMQANVFVLPQDIPVEEALRRLGGEPGQLDTETLLVLDRDRILRGGVSVATLLRASPDKLIAEILSPVPYAVPARMSLMGVQHHEAWQSWQWLPVINKLRQFVGLLRHIDMHHGLEQLTRAHPAGRSPTDGMELAKVYGETLLALFGTFSEVFLPRKDRRE